MMSRGRRRRMRRFGGTQRWSTNSNHAQSRLDKLTIANRSQSSHGIPSDGRIKPFTAAMHFATRVCTSIRFRTFVVTRCHVVDKLGRVFIQKWIQKPHFRRSCSHALLIGQRHKGCHDGCGSRGTVFHLDTLADHHHIAVAQ